MNSNSASPQADHDPDLRAALEIFQQTGNPEPCLTVLGVPAGRNPLLALQGALREATTRWERDALEDIAFRLSEGEGGPATPAPDTEELVRHVTASYGEHASGFLPREDIGALAKGLWRLGTPPPSPECLRAILQIELDRAVGDFVSVASTNRGDTLTIYHTHCPGCGGVGGGRGHVYCPHCLARARTRLEAGLASGLYSLRQSGPPDLELVSRQFLTQFAADYGCDRCHQHPDTPCSCAREVAIPDRPREGQVLKGRHLASGQDWYCCVRLRED